MNFKKAFNSAAIIALAVFGATGCGGGGGVSVSYSSHTPHWTHSGRTGLYIVVTSCSFYNSLDCYCDTYGCWYDNSGWYNIGGGYYTGYWPSDTSNYGNSSNSSSGSYYGGSTSSSGNSSNSSNSSSSYYNSGSSSYGNSSNSSNSGSYYNSGSNYGSSNTSNSGNSSNSSSDPYGHTYSVGGQTKDVDLQNADLQNQELSSKAETLASQYHMDFSAALQLSQLADKFDKLSIAGKMTDEDRAAIIDSSLSVAGISQADVNKAIQDGVNGNKHAMDDLLEQGAKNLGMPNSAGLRDQILPQLGIKL